MPHRVDTLIADAHAARNAFIEALGAELKRLEGRGIALETVIFPHPLSGPMDVWQRLAFLRFHLDRHREQVRAVQAHAAFPAK